MDDLFGWKINSSFQIDKTTTKIIEVDFRPTTNPYYPSLTGQNFTNDFPL